MNNNDSDKVENPHSDETLNLTYIERITISIDRIIASVDKIVGLLSRVISLITWPLLVGIILLLFYTPIKQTIDVLPRAVRQSQEISVGNLTLKLQENAITAGNPELAKIIGGLSKDAIKWILKLGDTSYRIAGSNNGSTGFTTYYFINPEDLKTWSKLQGKGLLKTTTDLKKYKNYFNSLHPIAGKIQKDTLTTEQEKKLLDNEVRLNETGMVAYEIILDTVAVMIR